MEGVSVGFGKLNTNIDIIEKQHAQDEEGFSSASYVVLASVRAYREGRHGSEKWANRASFSNATDLFRFRAIPEVKVTTAMVIACKDRMFEIISVEDVKGRGMYIEVLAKEVAGSG